MAQPWAMTADIVQTTAAMLVDCYASNMVRGRRELPMSTLRRFQAGEHLTMSLSSTANCSFLMCRSPIGGHVSRCDRASWGGAIRQRRRHASKSDGRAKPGGNHGKPSRTRSIAHMHRNLLRVTYTLAPGGLRATLPLVTWMREGIGLYGFDRRRPM